MKKWMQSVEKTKNCSRIGGPEGPMWKKNLPSSTMMRRFNRNDMRLALGVTTDLLCFINILDDS